MTANEVSDTPGLIMPPPFFLLIAVALAIALEWMIGPSFLAAPGITSLQSWAGLLVLAAAIALAISGIRAFTREGTNVHPTQPALKLVTSGPYRFTRNPMYLGMVLFLLGLSLVFSLEWALILVPFLWLAYDRLVVAREEAYLSRKFGTPYTDFLGRTRRWL
jgi:protein-S-isoprenylcysteine O-methyltransferase Ste14